MDFVQCLALTLLCKPEVLGFVLLEKKKSTKDLTGLRGFFILYALSTLKPTPKFLVMNNPPMKAAKTREGNI